MRVVVARIADWMDNFSTSWAAYRVLMACCLVALDKSPGVRPVGIGETPRRVLAKLVMRAARDQAKTACGNLQLCAVLEYGIDGATHAVIQRSINRVRVRRREEEAWASDEEEDSRGVAAALDDLTIETAGIEEEAVDQLEEALNMDIEGAIGGVVEGEEGGDRTQGALRDIEFLTQYAEPSSTTLIDTRNEFNELSLLAMLWTGRHRWPTGARSVFNCYRHWAQLLLRHPGEPPVTILIIEGLTQGDPLLMVCTGLPSSPLPRS